VSNIEVKTVKFGSIELQYIEEETGVLLFSVQSLAKGFEIRDGHSIWYRKPIQKYISFHKTERGKRALRFLTKEGVYQLLAWRHPVWEVDFYKTFEAKDPLDSLIDPLGVIPPDNLENGPISPINVVPTLIRLDERQDKMDIKLDKLIELVGTPTAAVVRNPKLIPIWGTESMVRVPSKAEHLFINMGKARMWNRTPRVLNGSPMYTHVEGYRTYKEMLAVAGLDILISTQKGRDLSRRMAMLARKHGISYYLVVDALRYHQNHLKNKPTTLHIGTYSINAYPKELWAVVEPVAQKYLDELSNG
jgi:hypothetical protein